ncbi:MAG TPA: excinuclease ABC subunit UvrC [Chloroflexota bacterium]|nr:excinuclease ABC subunit UvrC [Chloroflexota bacterium]
MELPRQVAATLKSLPDQPGVYLHKDAQGTVLYVGKAKSLRSRVRSYFNAEDSKTAKLRSMVGQVAAIDYILVDNPVEALVLECNLIKRYRPKYNVMLRDDKNYPYIKISLDEDFPRVYRTRNYRKDGARYFGPFTSSKSLDETLRLLKKIFPYRSCNRPMQAAPDPTKALTARTRPCLDYYIHRCIGPCIRACSAQDYAAVIDDVQRFLEGRHDEIAKGMQARMEQAAEELRFEEAALLRDRVRAIGRVLEKQRIVSTGMEDQDVIALGRDKGDACVLLLAVRGGKVLGQHEYVMSGTQDETEAEILEKFVEQYYDSATNLPAEVLLQHPIDDMDTVAQWLREKRHKRVQVLSPQRGEKRRLIELAEKNARETLQTLKVKWLTDDQKVIAGLTELADYLELDRVPQRIECYDISNTSGADSVGSMIVFAGGRPKTSDYRRFKIKTVAGADDYASLQEVLRRRFKRAGSDEGSAWASLPDLIIIDGGKGQLSAAVEALAEAGVDAVPVAGLAKEREELFLPGNPEPILLPSTSQGLYLVQRIRDEAHRFAITYHRALRAKSSITSQLDEIPGIGPRRKKDLLKHFGSVKQLRQASLEQVAAVPGFSTKLAELVKDYLPDDASAERTGVATAADVLQPEPLGT